MKNLKILFLLIIGVFSVQSAFSGSTPDRSSGCGLGWKVSKQKSIISSSIRALTNGTASNSIGMTSGTSGCTRHSLVRVNKKLEYYTHANFDILISEMSEGKGEILSGLSQILGCNHNILSSEIQKDYKSIITDDTTPSSFIQRLKRQINNNSTLTKNCRLIM
jgi:hypothetical protein